MPAHLPAQFDLSKSKNKNKKLSRLLVSAKSTKVYCTEV